MSKGWIKLHRKAINNGWLKNHKLWVFWTYCLLKAAHKKYYQLVGFKKIEILPGQFIFGRNKASKETGLSSQSIRTCAKALENMKNITIKTTNKFSMITITEWLIYQDDNMRINQQANQQLTNSQPTTNQQLTTNKNNKNIKKNKNNIYTVKRATHFQPQIKKQIDTLISNFEDHLKTYLPNIFKSIQNDIQSHKTIWINTIDKLIRIDKYSIDDIVIAVQFAVKDSFWINNFQSLSKLRRKNKEGIQYIAVFLQKSPAYKDHKAKIEQALVYERFLNDTEEDLFP